MSAYLVFVGNGLETETHGARVEGARAKSSTTGDIENPYDKIQTIGWFFVFTAYDL